MLELFQSTLGGMGIRDWQGTTEEIWGTDNILFIELVPCGSSLCENRALTLGCVYSSTCMLNLSKSFIWVGQKVHLDFSITCYGKTRTNFWANLIQKNSVGFWDKGLSRLKPCNLNSVCHWEMGGSGCLPSLKGQYNLYIFFPLKVLPF